MGAARAWRYDARVPQQPAVGALVVAALTSVLLGACGGAIVTTSRLEGSIWVDRAPPPPPSATRMPGSPPYEGAAWVEGHWEWDGLQFVWVDAYWIDAGSDVLVQPGWERRGDRWEFVPGHLVPPDGAEGSMEFRAVPGPPHRAGSGSGGSAGTVIAVPPPKGLRHPPVGPRS